jgi:PBP1b-binding outer membrane lipoprotein LpoB
VDAQKKTLLAVSGIALVALLLNGSFSSAQPPSQQVQANRFQELPEKLEGTYVISTALDTITMIAIVDPEFRTLDGKLFLVGIVSEKNGFIRDTPFTGGMTYIPMNGIHTIQQLKNEG